VPRKDEKTKKLKRQIKHQSVHLLKIIIYSIGSQIIYSFSKV